MGSAESDALATYDEKPQRRVRMSAFCIDRTEVTVAQYRACHGCSRDQLTGGGSYCTWSDAPGRLEDYPINCVDWNQADAFCRAAGKELPTEAQWEYAARGNDGRVYPWGNDAPTATRANLCGEECVVAHSEWSAFPNFGGDAYADTAPVGRFPAGASPFGALDMIGNVWEWTADYGLNYRDLGTQPDPRGVDRRYRALRGGSLYDSNPRGARAASRYGSGLLIRYDSGGFRCARGVTAGSVNRH